MKTDINIIDTLAGTTELINLDQLNIRNPITVLTGAEIVPAQKSGITGGLLLSTLKSWVKSAFVANDISNATTIGKSVLTSANLTAVKTLLEIPTLPPPVVPLEPVSLGSDTTLDETYVNRKIIITTSGIDLTTDADAVEYTDTIFIINPTSGDVTLDAGSGENFIVVGSSTPVTTLSIESASSIRITLIDSNTWFVEPSIV